MAAKRYQTPLSVIVIDADDLKKVNDSYGSAAGDQLLQEAAAVFAANIRQADLAGRMGGHEFLVPLPTTKAPDA
ncbi:MAG: GGDEF domain-containing protein [Firmicutes bacterium]|nr:GGDEF domain-containing protein [Bacillota bacterium]